MLPCPRCHTPLRATKTLAGMVWDCPRNHGRFAQLRVLKGLVHDLPLSQAWKDAHWGETRPGCPCPTCHRAMTEVRIHVAGVEVDVCRLCKSLWLDQGEQQQLPPRTQPVIAEESTDAERAFALVKVKDMQRRYQEGEAIGDGPDETWKRAVGVLGLPVELGAMTPRNRPWVTWAGLLIVAATSLWAMSSGLRSAIDTWGFVPADPWRHGGLTWLSGFFLHGGFWHLLGNLYLWWMVGDNVEDVLGRRRYVLVLLAGMVGGSLLHLIGDPRPHIPCVGASDAISALMAVYALCFPRAQIGLPFFYGVVWLRIPATVVFILWLGLQSLMAWQQVTGFGNVSALAHLGGVIVGVALWWWWIGSQGRRVDDA